MNKLSEARLRVLIQEELENVELELEKKEKLERNISDIDAKIVRIKAAYENENPTYTNEDISLAGLSNLAISGSGDVVKAITGGGAVGTAVEQFAKDVFANFVLGRLGLKPGKRRDLLKSFIEELTLEELYDFMRDPTCEKFVDHSMDALIDFVMDMWRAPIQAFSNTIRSGPTGGIAAVVLSRNRGTDILSKLLSGVGTEALGEMIKDDPRIRHYIEKNIVPGACEVWDNVWDQLDLEDATMTLSKALDKAYPAAVNKIQSY